MGNTPTNSQWGEVHGIVLTIAWFGLENIAIWALHFTQKSWSTLVHILCMSLSAGLMIVGCLVEIVLRGPRTILFRFYHHTWGFVLLCILPLILLSGALCKLGKFSPQTSPSRVFFKNKAHSIFGWFFILCTKVPLLSGWFRPNKILFGVIIGVTVLSYCAYLYLKFFRKKIEAVSVKPLNLQNSIRQIRSSKDLRIYSDNFFIFANYVYSLNPILGVHPGGWKIIQAIKGREVDRFLYGVDPIQFFNVSKVSHSQKSIQLAGEPMAKLKIRPTFSSLKELNKVKVMSLSCHDQEMKIHCLYLKFQQNRCMYNGYSHLSQIGQYYSLTYDNLTRLHTAVNFLQPQNIGLMNRLSKGLINLNKKQISLNSLSNEEMISEELIEGQSGRDFRNILPLLIKKYGDGKFTSEFLTKKKKKYFSKDITISEPRGLGLSLDSFKDKRIVLFAGGTGLYPFSDFIDLLYKSMVMETNPGLSDMLIESDPILQSNPFADMSVTLYLAVNVLSQLHPITLFQCNELCQSNNFKCFAKIKSESQTLKSKYGQINIFNNRFEDGIQKQLQKDSQTVFFICGPVRFTNSIIKELQNLNTPLSNYRIV